MRIEKNNNKNLHILLYHGVTRRKHPGIVNYSGKHLYIDDFRRHMKLIKQRCNLLTIDEIVELDRTGKIWPQNSVVVTFDDGFHNNYECAASILDDFKIPAVFYICAGLINTDEMLWVDQIEDCINRTNKKDLEIKLDKGCRFKLNSLQEKILALEQIKKFCKKSSSDNKDRVLEELISKTNITPDVNASLDYKLMSWHELRSISQNSLFTIGGHTLCHDIMSALPVPRMDLDIKLTLGLLKYHLGHNITHFSYPEGQAIHYNDNVISSLKRNGVICSPSAIDGANSPGADLFHLKRIMVGFHGNKFPYE